ncbi:hypothetical protein KFK09_025651 [Dendrobium nobile]|uniref:Uncharacterized protein n=1 Tax=Dendrobium nobile TaxID=94219 RepID=A0A8T3A668_DENNO|nr:hypothetical protein KFK09_025651 [Dendrobium nobile]
MDARRRRYSFSAEYFPQTTDFCTATSRRTVLLPTHLSWAVSFIATSSCLHHSLLCNCLNRSFCWLFLLDFPLHPECWFKLFKAARYHLSMDQQRKLALT